MRVYVKCGYTKISKAPPAWLHVVIHRLLQYMHVYMNMYMHIYLHKYMYVYVHVHVYVYVYVYVFVHVYMHTCTCTCICTYIHTYIFVVVNFDALAQASDFRIERRQIVFLCWMQDSNPEGLWNLFSSRLNACWQTDWAIEDQAKNLNSTARPYDQQAFSPPDPIAIWHSHLALAIYIFVVVNFDALVQASDFRNERRQVVVLCWMQDSNPGGLWSPFSSRLNACWQTDWAIEDQAKNIHTYIHICCC